MAYNHNPRNVFVRPKSAERYINAGQVIASQGGQVQTVIAPTALKVRPANSFRTFNESDASVPNPETGIICGGTPILNAAKNGIGVLMNDTKPGTNAPIKTSGLFFVPLDYLGASSPTARTASSVDPATLNGKRAYYIVGEGLFTDQDPDEYAHLEVGFFRNIAGLEGITNAKGSLYWALVELDPGINNAAVSAPADAANLSNTTVILANLSFKEPTRVGLKHTVLIGAEINHPNYEVRDEDISTLVEGVTYIGRQFTHTFAVGTDTDIVISINRAGVNYSTTYSADFATGAAPANLSRDS